MKRDHRFVGPRLLLGCLLVAAPSETIIPAEPAEKALPVTVPFEMVRGHILLPTHVNDSPPLSFMLDTGFSVTMIHPQRAKELQLKRVSSTTIAGIAGNERADVFGGITLNVGGASYSPRRIAALPSERGSRRRRDGILGAGFFRRFVVEIDFIRKTIALHDPAAYQYTGHGQRLPLHFRQTTPLVDATLHLPDRPQLTGRFEVDTGCDDALCVGRDFVEANHLADTSSDHVEERIGVGGSTRVRPGNVLELQLGELKVEKPSTNFFLDGSPVDKDLAGHMGLGALKPFKVIFDYSRREMILER